MSADGTKMYFVDLSSEYQQSQQLETKPRNFVATENNSAMTKIVAYCMTTDRRNLVTLERLVDSRTDIEVASLKFWRKSTEDYSDFQLAYFVHLGRLDGDPYVCAISDDQVAVCLGNDEVKIWQISQDAKWSVVASLHYQGLTVRQILPCKLRLKSKKGTGMHLAVLHEKGHISFWSREDWTLDSSMATHSETTKIVFEASYRYLAALKPTGSVSVWKMKGEEPSHQWDLNFHSVTKIVSNPLVENQFFVMMSSDDKADTQNSVLLFQFSRPQNLIMYWKFKTPITGIHFVNALSCLYVSNRNGECQKIYCSVSQDKLKE
jgi:hypothetical protein